LIFDIDSYWYTAQFLTSN